VRDVEKLLAVAAIATAAVLGTPVAQADPGWGRDDCDCGGYYGGPGWDGGYYGGWYPGKWVSGCVSGPFGYAQVCW
jgi:hypothetical protein